ncbi:Diacylglycerol o-acyltransferase [Mycena chlorophos]|uniref:diacylglycerol O-acyltransferase n=1 Tax=Mycena chlorophos TaxID=658473 RepID=A0A8H6RYR5_MYCCL|nr:Diacylglycerol o-acyltransferase [Mycena chlorophos]
MSSLRRLSNASRSLSAQSLKDKLGKLSTTPIVPKVATALQANIDFVPARIPRKRRLQTLVVALFSIAIPVAVALFLYLCSYPPLWPLLVVYLIWVNYIDDGPENGTRSSDWFRSLKLWTYFVDYYPASFLKARGREADLPPDRPYLFGYHPHGIIGMGALATFATDATGFSKAFPGIKPHLLTLATNFQIPLYRDMLLAMGICSVSKRSCSNILRAGPGSAITIVVGGATESLSAHPGTADLTLRRRLGFIKMAIRHGADLVPVFSFGENDIYEQMPNEPGTTIYSLQQKFKSVFGFTLPLFHGRGLLNYNLGLMPYRRQIVAVIGRPIRVTQADNPTLDEVTAVQKLYIEELERIWNTYKDVFAKSRTRELRMPPKLDKAAKRMLSGKTPFFACTADQRFSFCMYIPSVHKFETESHLPLLVAVHGTRRNVGGLISHLKAFSEEQGIAVLCPLFPAGIIDPTDVHNYKNVLYRDIRFDEVLFAMLDQAAGIWRVNTSKFFLHGFSGGGQFAHRFLYLHPQRLLGVSIGAPGSITRPQRDVNWPQGVADIERVFGQSIDWDAVKAVSVQVLVGEKDTATDMLSGEGGTRVDRARRLHSDLTGLGCITLA